MAKTMSTLDVFKRLYETIVIKPFKFFQKRIPCLNCSCRGVKQQTKLTSIFSPKEGGSKMELFDTDDDNDEDLMSEEEDDTVGSSDDEDMEDDKVKSQHRKLKKAGKSVRKAIGKGLIAYSAAALVTPMPPVGIHRLCKHPGQETTYDYYSASYGVYI